MVRIITILVCMLLCPAGAFAQGDSARVFTDNNEDWTAAVEAILKE